MGFDNDFEPGVAELTVDGQRWGELHVRFKGNSSFRFAINSIKKSLKLDFDALDKDARFFGMAKLNLNNNAMDSSGLRESLAYDVFREDGTAAPRTAYTRVYLTVPGTYQHTYAGLYTIVEQVDQTFMRDRFAAKTPMLLKPARQGGQPYRGESWASYRMPYGDKSDTKAADGQRLIALTRLLGQASDDVFAHQIVDLLDVDAFLHYVAVQSVLVNLDSPLLSGGNYYLVTHPKNGKILFLPWDLNEAFGGFMSGPAAETMSVRQPAAQGEFALAERILASDAFRARYETIVRTVVTKNFTPARLGREIAARSSLVRDAVTGDPMMVPAEFERNLIENPPPMPSAPGGFGPGPGRGPGGDKPPLLQFIVKRTQSVLDQLDGKVQGQQPPRVGPPNGRGRGGD